MLGILGGLGTQALGGLFGSMFKNEDSITDESYSQGAQIASNLANRLLPVQQQATLQGLYSSAGTGQGALNAFNNAYRSLGPSAEAVAGAAQQGMLASSMLGSADRSYQSAATETQRNLRNLQENAQTAARGSGGSIASIAGIARNVANQGNTQLAAMQNQSASQNAAATQAASQMLGQGAQMITNDTAQRAQFLLDPLAVKDNGSAGATVGSFGNILGQTANNVGGSQTTTKLMSDPLAGLSAGLGSIGTQLVDGGFDNYAIDELMKRLNFQRPI